MSKWVKIDNDYFEVESIETQLTIASHSAINIIFNIDKKNGCYNYLTSWFDESFNNTKSSFIRKISCKNFDAMGCFIKTLDFNPVKNNISVIFSCDYLEQVDISERRNEKIEEILNKKT
jgi:hypothetical protein